MDKPKRETKPLTRLMQQTLSCGDGDATLLSSRRKFLLNTAGFLTALGWVDPQSAFAAKRGKAPVVNGPHPLARQDWPPAIVPDHIGVDRGYCCFTDEFGRLAVLDLRKPDDPRNPPHVVAELNGLGKKVIDFHVVAGRGYGAVVKALDSGDAQLTLICVGLTPATDPEVIGEISLDKFVEVSCLSAAADLVCIAGTSANGDYLVAIYGVPRKGKHIDPVLLSTWSASGNIVDLEIQDRYLAVLQPTQLDYVSLVEPHTPETKGTLKLDGEFQSMTRFKDLALVCGTAYGDTAAGRQLDASVGLAIQLSPTPHLLSSVPLAPMTNILDCCAIKDRFLVLGDGSNERYVTVIGFDKARRVRKDQTVSLPKEKGSYGAKSCIVASAKSAYVASGWAGIEVLLNSGTTWTPGYNYTIPRLPASGIATWGDRVVISGADLKVYDIAEPTRLSLIGTAILPGSLRSIVGAGSYVLCLSRDSVSLRKMENLETIAATMNISGQQVCYDPTEKKAYVLSQGAKKTTITKLKVYSNDVSSESTFDLPPNFVKAAPLSGKIAVCGLNDISLYNMGAVADLIGTRHFENLAIRDIALRDNCIVASAVDQKSKGFLLLLSRDQKNLRILGSIDLPHDGAALAADKNRVVVVGKSGLGKDVATIIDISNVGIPKIVATMDAVEAASAVAIRDKVAIVAGRGIEILSLS
jgi:hypothetical protein